MLQPREERHIDKQDTEKNKEFPHLDTDDQKYLNSILTPAAFRTLLTSEHSFAGLFTILDQPYDHTQIFSIASDGKVNTLNKNPQYAVYYSVMQQRMQYNQQIIAGGNIDYYNDLVNMSVCFHWNQGGKIAGFTMYTRLTDLDSLGDAMVLAFYHAKLRRVVMLKILGPAFRIAGSHFIGKHGVVTPFDKACGWCGRAAEDLKKCPCKGSRYCNGDCQRMHWPMHRSECKTHIGEV